MKFVLLFSQALCNQELNGRLAKIRVPAANWIRFVVHAKALEKKIFRGQFVFHFIVR